MPVNPRSGLTGFDLPGLLAAVDAVIAQGGGRDRLLGRVVALLHDRLAHYTWVGVYLLDGDELVLGPFRGRPSPHTRIPLNRGICGAAASRKQTIVVPDVTADPRFLACSLETRSEIVVPIMDGVECLGEIDIDSDLPDAFGESDQLLLEEVAVRLAPVVRAG